MAPSSQKIARRAALLGLLAVLAVAGFAVTRYAGGNTATLEAGVWYRSGQLGPRGLERMFRDRGVRSVLNLRGANPDAAWYRAERAATLAAGGLQIDIAMASDHWLSRAQMGAVARAIRDCPKPALVHCEWGAERTGLVSALITLASPDGSVEDALAQFSPYYLYLPTPEGRVMRGHVAAYAQWLARSGRTHAPAAFFEWALEAYRPGFPSRDDWPYDPYPLVVQSTTGPARLARAAETNADVPPQQR